MNATRTLSWVCNAPAITTTQQLQVRWSLDWSQVSEAWIALQPQDNLLLREQLLQSISCGLCEDVRPLYGIVSLDGQPKGLAYIHLFEFKAAQAFRDLEHPGWWQTLRKQLAQLVNLKTIQLGNLLFSGPYGWTPTLEQQHLQGVLDSARQFMAAQGWNAQLLLCKDIATAAPEWNQAGYTHFATQPAMSMEIPVNWRKIEDYTQALQARYRTRYHRARKKKTGIVSRQMTIEEVAGLAPQMQLLYENLSKGAGFSIAHMTEQYWISLVNLPQETCVITGYFEGTKLVGFTTLLHNGPIAEAHYLGLDPVYNASHQLYLNMLFDMLETAINWRVQRICYGRTALEIKSSVGARPQQFHCYLRAVSPVLNLFSPALVKVLNPPVAWEERHPFRQSPAGF